MLPLIESAQNPKIKGLTALLQKHRARRDSLLFAVEGVREVTMALCAGYIPQALYYLPQIISDPHQSFTLPQELQCQPVSLSVYQKIAYRESTEGVVAVLHQQKRELTHIHLSSNPLILVTEAVEKPGNIGAILRTADAARVDAVLVCDPHCDLYNPNLIRASIGALFTCKVITCTSKEAVAWLQQHQIRIYAATLQDSVPYHTQNYTFGSAIVVGSEANGLSPIWRDAAFESVQIPMFGAIDSLNVSVSTSIILFEALRQRMVGSKMD